jgi:hypothetical protein
MSRANTIFFQYFQAVVQYIMSLFLHLGNLPVTFLFLYTHIQMYILHISTSVSFSNFFLSTKICTNPPSPISSRKSSHSTFFF